MLLIGTAASVVGLDLYMHHACMYGALGWLDGFCTWGLGLAGWVLHMGLWVGWMGWQDGFCTWGFWVGLTGFAHGGFWVG